MLGAGDEAAERAQRLRQRPHSEDVGILGHVWTQDRVRFVDHQQRVVTRAHVEQVVERRLVAVHREDRVGDDDGRAVMRREQCIDVGDVAMAGDLTRPRDRRQPSMIDAWLSSSLTTSTPAVANVVSTPRFAANPVGKRSAASVSFQAASSLSSSRWTGREPTINRAEPEPVPQRSSASAAALTTAGCCDSPR